MKELNKVAKVTLLFWLMKICATTLGETLGDFLAQTLGLGYSVGILITLAFLFWYWWSSSCKKNIILFIFGW
ncbi:hypothetical protein [Cellulophaga sp. Z1A5H]|uniref:hypothetical protein n=1 Tax=Cellulophaga sp. Z1A5H TaxID=2687291 RepID=UPI001F108188|nr:hypothetical protein [Cellulophaga sp. Z1A5H]